ncbi:MULTISPECIES: MASE3 domain-containing protein [Ramlibacter]|uniref:histidine kinase n=1 Tax=Ramlibacter aquaticus TaxID=2780094 RepID=A0ABR9SJV8_9BURK|nr:MULTISPECIES: MASE3 domain-containing protein [Ramlibacter]MBE7942062.1 PAS domain S-box protein [Ramlibacter aquaticus]
MKALRDLSPEQRRSLAALGLATAVLGVLLSGPLQFRLPTELNAGVHSVLEMAAIAIASIVFAVGWNAYGRRGRDTDAVVWLAFLAVALVDGLHTLSFEGMPAFFGPSGRGKAIFFFLAARLIAGLALLYLALPRRRALLTRMQAHLLLAITVALAVGVGAAGILLPGLRELFFVPGSGLTPFKKACEYVVVAINLAAALLFLARPQEPGRSSHPLLMLACGLMALSEWSLTRYVATSDGPNVIGHFYKALAYLVIYRAIVVRTVSQPLAELDTARLELVATQQEYRELIEASLDGVVVLLYSGRFLSMNAAGQEIMGYTVEEVNRQGGVRLLHVGEDPRSRAFLAELRRARRARGRIALRCRRGPVEIEASANLYQLPSGQDLVCIIFRDVTGQIRQEQEIRELNATLEHRVEERTEELQRRNRDLEGLSYALAHDLRGDISRVQGYAGALAQALAPAPGTPPAHWLDRLDANIRRMHETVDGLLALAMVSTATVEPGEVDLADLARASERNLREQEPLRRVSVRVPPSLPVRGDRRLLGVAMDNLLGNAWKFTRDAQDAQIEVGMMPAADPAASGTRVYFVRDNGAGFDMAHAHRLFELFQRLHDQGSFSGHGVGLATLRRIIEHHHGRIWAEAHPGQGATFFFTLAAS